MTEAGTSEFATHAAVRTVLSDPHVFSLEGDALECGQRRPLIPLQSSTDDHELHRSLLGWALTHSAAEASESSLRLRANQLVDVFESQETVDVNARFSRPFPVLVLLDVLGLPAGDWEMVRGFHDRILGQSGSPDARDEVAEQIYAYLEPIVATRRGTDGDDLIRCLQRARQDGRSLSDDQVVDVCYLLLLAGIDPVGNAIANGVALLAGRRDLRRQLDEHPSRWRRFTEELLRWGSAVKAVGRVVTETATIEGVELRPGERIGCAISSANRDPSVFSTPEEFDPDRARIAHLSFGAGPHHCIGAALARLQVRVALQELQRRLPEYRIEEVGAPTVDAASIGAADRLELRLR